MPIPRHRLVIAFLGLGLLATAAQADKKALVGGTLVNGLSSTPIRDSVILVDGEVIEAVGTMELLPVPEGYEVISTEAMTVLPGLWEMHAHLMLNGHSDYAHWHQAYPDRCSSEIMPASAVQLLLAGITTARDLGAPLEESIDVRDRIARGEIHGPRLFVSGPFIQHQPCPGSDHYRWGVESPRDAREKVDRLADAGVDVIKMVDQDEMSFEEVQAVVDQAHKRGLKVAGHSHRPEELLYFQLTPKRKPTLQRKIQQLREAGVVLLVGVDSGMPMKFHCQSTWSELDVWVNVMGIPAMEAIQAPPTGPANSWASRSAGAPSWRAATPTSSR